MARARRPLTELEQSKPCPLCGAQPGQRCTNPGGDFYATGSHAARRTGAARQASSRQNRTYRVLVCLNCQHPGGAHIVDGGCRLCRECPGWVQNGKLSWSDHKTREMLAAMRSADA